MIAENLRQARQKSGMKLKDVAAKTGLSISFVSDLENDRTDPSLRSLGLLAECYGVSIAVLIAGYRPEKAECLFSEGDKLRNINLASHFHGLVGTFKRYWSDRYYFHRGRGCDVVYPGIVDLYGREETAQCAADLELVSSRNDQHTPATCEINRHSRLPTIMSELG
jgi:transcriptional regulator with XRE-family HTH domain